MKRLLLLTPLCFFLLGAAPGVPTEKNKERITKKELSQKTNSFSIQLPSLILPTNGNTFAAPSKKLSDGMPQKENGPITVTTPEKN